MWPDGDKYVVVRDVEGATRALQEAGIDMVGGRDVIVVDVADRPGAMGEICRRIADAGVDIRSICLAAGTRLVLGVEDIDRAQTALSEAGLG